MSKVNILYGIISAHFVPLEVLDAFQILALLHPKIRDDLHRYDVIVDGRSRFSWLLEAWSIGFGACRALLLVGVQQCFNLHFLFL